VGVILYRMLTGKLPFHSENSIGVILKHLSEIPIPPSVIAPNVHRRLEVICLRALAKDPMHRYQTAREMRSALRAVFDLPSSPSVQGWAANARASAPSLPEWPLPPPAPLLFSATERATVPRRLPTLPLESRRRAFLGVTLLLGSLAIVGVFVRTNRATV